MVGVEPKHQRRDRHREPLKAGPKQVSAEIARPLASLTAEDVGEVLHSEAVLSGGFAFSIERMMAVSMPDSCDKLVA